MPVDEHQDKWRRRAKPNIAKSRRHTRVRTLVDSSRHHTSILSKRWLVALVVVTSVAASTAAAQTAPSKLILKPTQVGPGYAYQTIPNGRCIDGCVTLNLCGSTYLSEALRTARAQVGFLHAGPSVQVSNEVVAYRSGGIDLARRELLNAVKHCPTKPVENDVQGVGLLLYRVKYIPTKHLLSSTIALQVLVTGKSNGRRASRTIVMIYQFKGNTMSAIYAYGGPGVRVAEQIKLALHAAAESAANLRRSAP